MERGIGYNVSLSYISPETRAWMESYIRDAKPASMLMFDTRGDEAVYVKWLARTYPDTTFEYRLWIPEETNPKNGDNQQLYLSAAAWVEKHRAFAGTRIYCSVNNEPNHGDVTRTCRWHIDVMQKAHAAGIRTAIGGYAYGHPNSGPLDPSRPENWEVVYGPYDEQMKAVAAAGNMAIVDVHEYGNRFLRDAVPYLIGRYKFWQSHLKREGIGPVRWNIGEHGWATIEADDKPEYWLFYTIVNSWGLPDWQTEMARQLKDIWKSVYADDPYIVGADLFTLADYAWPRSTYTKAPAAREMMRQGFSTMDAPDTTPPVTKYAPGEYTLSTEQSHINLRSSTGADLGDIRHGDRVTVVDTNTISLPLGGVQYTAQRVRHNNVTGFIALTSSFTLTPFTPSPEPDDIEREMVKFMRATGNSLLTQADEFERRLNARSAANG